MKIYKFIRLNIGLFAGEPQENYYKIVDDNAKDGWNLIQIFAPPIAGYGRAKFYELIFEKNDE